MHICIGSPAHGHDAAWNILLTGRKHWFLSPPNTLGYRSRFWAKERHPIDDIPIFQELIKQGIGYEIIQYPGDVIFVPTGWVHMTINLCDTIAIAQEFGTYYPWDIPIDITQELYT